MPVLLFSACLSTISIKTKLPLEGHPFLPPPHESSPLFLLDLLRAGICLTCQWILDLNDYPSTYLGIYRQPKGDINNLRGLPTGRLFSRLFCCIGW